MSMRDRANQTLNDFNPDEKINGYEGLQSGTYPVVVEDVSLTDWGSFSMKVSVMEGDDAGRVEFIQVSLDENSSSGKPLPDFVIDRNIKTLAKLAFVTGVTIDDDSWDNISALPNDFADAKGKVFEMELKLRENKNRPEYPYKEYEFNELEQPEFSEDETLGKATDPFADSGSNIEVSDDDMPF